jgi:5-methylcytosine-specific restriction protein A
MRAMPLRSELEAVTAGLPGALDETYAGHPLAQRIRGALAEKLRALINDDSYKVEGSAGAGRWAETMWVAVFDRLITESAQNGYYPVYLFRRDGAGVYLSLCQGTTTVLNEFGRGQYLDVLRKAAAQDVARLDRTARSGLLVGPLELPGSSDLSRGYAAGSILAVYYEASALPDDDSLARDLARFIELYSSVAEARTAAAGGRPGRNQEGHRGGPLQMASKRRAQQLIGEGCEERARRPLPSLRHATRRGLWAGG